MVKALVQDLGDQAIGSPLVPSRGDRVPELAEVVLGLIGEFGLFHRLFDFRSAANRLRPSALDLHRASARLNVETSPRSA